MVSQQGRSLRHLLLSALHQDVFLNACRGQEYHQSSGLPYWIPAFSSVGIFLFIDIWVKGSTHPRVHG